MIHSVALSLTSAIAIALSAQTASPPTEDIPPPPLEEPAPLPPKAVGPDQPAPTVTIRRDDEGALVEEYRLNGSLYMVKVTPLKGPPFYLVDTDGDGELETKQIESDPGVKPIYWKLFQWK